MTPARFRWGMLLVLLGVLLLLVNADVLNHDFWLAFIFYFPFILIAIGIEKIFARTQLKMISYLTTVALVAGAFYVAFTDAGSGDRASFFGEDSITWETDGEQVDIVKAILDLDNDDLTVRDATGDLFRARFGEWSYKPDAQLLIKDGVANIDLVSRSGRNRYWGGAVIVDSDEPSDWRLQFARDIPLILTCTGSDNDIHLNFGTTPLRELTLDIDDADAYVKFGDFEPVVRLTVEGYDSKLRLRLPQDAGLAVTATFEPDYFEEIGLIADGERYVTEGYADAEPKIEVDLRSDFRSLSIDFY